MARVGRAQILREPDDQYTVLFFSRPADGNEQFISASSNLTFAQALTSVGTAMTGFPNASEKIQKIDIDELVY